MSIASTPRGALVVWTDCAPETEAEWNDWYDREHLLERAGVPGFQNGRRYRAVRGKPRYLALYDLDDVAVLKSPPYIARLDDPTPWTAGMMPLFRNFIRSAFHVRWKRGAGYGSVVATLRLAGSPAPDLDATGKALAGLVDQPGVVGASLWEADPEISQPQTTERALRSGEDTFARWAMLVEGRDEALMNAAIAAALSASVKSSLGWSRARRGTYRLLRGV